MQSIFLSLESRLQTTRGFAICGALELTVKQLQSQEDADHFLGSIFHGNSAAIGLAGNPLVNPSQFFSFEAQNSNNDASERLYCLSLQLTSTSDSTVEESLQIFNHLLMEQTNTFYSTEFLNAHDFMILHNPRNYTGEGKRTSKMTFQLENFVFTDKTYDLYAVIVHSGEDAVRGHFCCYIRKDALWYLINDVNVKEVTRTEVEAQDKDWFMLFYENCHQAPCSPISLPANMQEEINTALVQIKNKILFEKGADLTDPTNISETSLTLARDRNIPFLSTAILSLSLINDYIETFKGSEFEKLKNMSLTALKGNLTKKRNQRQQGGRESKLMKIENPKEEEMESPVFNLVNSPLFKVATAINDLDEENDLERIASSFKNIELMLTFNYPSSTDPISPRLQVKGGKIIYKVRESFSRLVEFVEKKWNGDRLTPFLHYIGPAGIGKSYNLCALAFYLRKQFHLKQSSRRVFYIPGCKQFFSDQKFNLKAAFSDCFPDEDFSEYKEISQFKKCEPRSVIFILDDYNWVLTEPSDTKEERKRRNTALELLTSLSSGQLKLLATSEYSSMWYKSRSHQPDKPSILEEISSLSLNEWKIWKASVPVFSRLSKDDEDMLQEFSGNIPLYLYYIERIMLDYPQWSMENVLNHFEGLDYEEGYIKQTFRKSTKAFLKNSETKDEFLESMMAATNETSVDSLSDCFDHRFFYYTRKNGSSSIILKAVNGYIRRILVQLLQKHDKEAFLKSVDENWVRKGLNNENSSIREFCFETYCLSKMIREKKLPSFVKGYIPDTDFTKCEFSHEQFDGAPDLLNQKGAVLYSPKSSYYPYIDCILRIVDKKKNVHIFAIQITIQQIVKHKRSLEFFNETTAQYRSFLKSNEDSHLHLVWMVPQPEKGKPRPKIAISVSGSKVVEQHIHIEAIND